MSNLKSCKAAKPARRKTAKKRVKVVKGVRKAAEIARLIRVAIKKPTPSKRAARSKSQVSTAAFKRLAGSLRRIWYSDTRPLRGHLELGVSKKEDRVVLEHRQREERLVPRA